MKGELLEEFEDVARVVGTYLGVHDLRQWNIRKVAGDPISGDDAAVVAHLVLKRRLREIRKQLPPNAPLRMNVIAGYERRYRQPPKRSSQHFNCTRSSKQRRCEVCGDVLSDRTGGIRDQGRSEISL